MGYLKVCCALIVLLSIFGCTFVSAETYCERIREDLNKFLSENHAHAYVCNLDNILNKNINIFFDLGK